MSWDKTTDKRTFLANIVASPESEQIEQHF